MAKKSSKITGVLPKEKIDVCHQAIRAITDITIPLMDAAERAGVDIKQQRERVMSMLTQFQAVCQDFAP